MRDAFENKYKFSYQKGSLQFFFLRAVVAFVCHRKNNNNTTPIQNMFR